MKRRDIEFLWAWFDALRRGETNAMAAALHPAVVWQGVREDLVCHGPDEVVAAFLAQYDADQEVDSVELIGGERHIVLGVRAPDLGEAGGVALGDEFYNVFAIENETITRIEDYFDRKEALAAAGVAAA